jgi:hypothetical protein
MQNRFVNYTGCSTLLTFLQSVVPVGRFTKLRLNYSVPCLPESPVPMLQEQRSARYAVGA